MIDLLGRAGFAGIESVGQAEAEVIHARLWASSIEFTAMPDKGGWRLSFQWPFRSTEAQRAEWMRDHPGLEMGLAHGETVVTMWMADQDAEALKTWALGAEAAVAQLVRWRRAQRQPGEGY